MWAKLHLEPPLLKVLEITTANMKFSLVVLRSVAQQGTRVRLTFDLVPSWQSHYLDIQAVNPKDSLGKIKTEVFSNMYESLTEGNGDAMFQSSDEEYQRSDRRRSTTVIRSGFILNIFISFLCCIIPGIQESGRLKDRYFIPAAVIVLCQWYTVGEYGYVIKTFWKNATYQNLSDTTNCPSCNSTCFAKLPPEMLVIRTETVILLMGLIVSGALTLTLGVLYFRRNTRRMEYDGRRKLHLLPRVNDDLLDKDELDDLSDKDWLQTNCLLVVGIIITILTILTDQLCNTYFDFVGIHNFLNQEFFHPYQKAMYSVALSMTFWGYGATICACCLFHAMALRIRSRIRRTELTVLRSVSSREGFFAHTNNLIRYKTEMTSMFKPWFATHNAVFIPLLAGIIYEWVKVLQATENRLPRECFSRLMAAQISGTLLIVYKFAFPIMSASLVTNSFTKYFRNIAFSNKIKDARVTEILALSEYTGFEIFFIRVTPKLSILLLVSCFIGVLNVVAKVG